MKLPVPFLAALAFTTTAFAGETMVSSDRAYHVSETWLTHCNRYDGVLKNAGTSGAFYRTNFSHNAVTFFNDTPHYMTFFIYSGDICGPVDMNGAIHSGAQVYEVVVPPYRTSFSDRRGRFFWVGSKLGKWGIDAANRQLARL